MHRQLSDENVRKEIGVYTVESELRARRLKWWSRIVQAPKENKQLLAVLFGTMEREVREGKVLGTVPGMRETTMQFGNGKCRGIGQHRH